MSILKNVRSFFSRNKHEQPSDANMSEQSSTEQPLPVSPPSPALSSPDNVIYIYSHGFTNGVYRIEPEEDSFGRFLEFCNQVDRIKELRVLKELALAEAQAKLNEATVSFADDTKLAIEKSKQAEHLFLSLTSLGQDKLKMDQKEAALVTQAREILLEYSWVPALFYMVAGITFIVADISITKQITSWGFNMSGIQSWIFAIGLAFTAFLIKPTVDRMLEKPFQAAGLKLKALYKGVLLGITVVGLVMLFVLGKFRSDSEMARGRIDNLNAQINMLAPDSQDAKNLQAQLDAIQRSLDENLYGQSGLILSGMLFAIGGAICLSISFGTLKQLISRYWILPFRIWRVRRKASVLTAQVLILQAEYTAAKTDQEKSEKSLSANEVVFFREEVKKLQEERSVLVSEFYEAQCKKEKALYLDGKNKGGKYSIEGELIYKTVDNDHASINLGKMDNEENQSVSSPRSYTRRPFVKIRKMIADNFNKNQNSPSYDGTEFEIVS